MGAQIPDQSVQSEDALQQKLGAEDQASARLRQHLAEARQREAELLDQQTATAEILRAIASASTGPQLVLDAVARNATRVCGAEDALIRLIDGDGLRLAARYGSVPGEDVGETLPLSRASVAGRAVLDRGTVHIRDLSEESEQEFREALRPTERRLGVRLRTMLATPLVREGVPIGAILIRRVEVRPFTDRQVAMLETFADQAVIAIENARLFAELRQSLDRQTATSDILQVISSSPDDPAPVFETIVANAARLCEADFAAVLLFDGERLASAAHTAISPEFAEYFERGYAPTRETTTGRAALERRPVQVVDILADPEFVVTPAHRSEGVRTVLAVPMLREGGLVGVIATWRHEVRPFSDRQIALLGTFADQAVIAIQNTRLFRDLRDRTAELAELNRTLEARVAEQVEQLERVGRLRRYLSPQLAELIISSGDESILESHRRQITVAFCDLRGFTAFAETAEPEEVMGVLGEYHAAMGPLIHEHGGTLDKFAGDGLMIIFNDPLPQPDHAERAVRMACAMRDRAAGLARGWRRQGHELGLGIGIAVGYATLGRIGFEGRSDYTAIGTVTNLAARLCGEAADGQVVIHGRVHSMVEELVEAESLGELVLKGLHRPVAAFNVLGLRDA